MNENEIIMVLLITLIGIAVILLLYLLVLVSRNRKEQYQRKCGNVSVCDGVDVRKQILGSEKGDYFTGNIQNYNTVIVPGQEFPVWKISFRDLKTEKLYQCRFRGRMWIGRCAMDSREVCLVLSDDGKISKIHCSVFEEDGRLFLEDMNSRNHTWLNQNRVNRAVPLQNGDVIKVGDTRLRVGFGK